MLACVPNAEVNSNHINHWAQERIYKINSEAVPGQTTVKEYSLEVLQSDSRLFKTRRWDIMWNAR